MEPELIVDYACETGEGPLWHPMEKRLYWADIPQGRMFHYDPATGQHEQFYDGDIVGGFTIQADGSLLLFMDRGAIAAWRDGELTYVIDELKGQSEYRFNDVFADPAGRVFCGTMLSDVPRNYDERTGKLYRLDTDGSIRPVLEGIGITNGIGLTPDRKQMYYTDTVSLKIYLFDYDEGTGEISNQRVFVETPEGEGFPDGMTVDAEGYVWSARWDGSALYRYDPDGVEERRIHFPAKKVSSLTFGGEDYTDIYVTTATAGNSRAEEGEGAGALFRLNLGIKGVPEYLSRVGI